MADIVPVPHKSKLQPGKFALFLLNRLKIGQDLAGVQQVGQAVNNRNVGVFRKFLHVVMREGPDHNSVQVAGKHPGCISNTFTALDL